MQRTSWLTRANESGVVARFVLRCLGLEDAAWRHVLVENARLYAGTEFGQRLAWRLSDFLAERCAVLREIWAEIPFTWEGGRAVATPPPVDHECASVHDSVP